MAITTTRVAPTVGFSVNTLTSLVPTVVAGREIAMKGADDAPFMVMVNQTQKMPAVNNVSFIVHDDERIRRTAVVSADVASGGTTINVDDASIFKPWDVLYCYEKEYRVMIVSISSNALTVVANVDSGGASAISAGDVVVNLGPALEDGTDLTSMIGTIPNAFTNYIELTQVVISQTKMTETAGNYYKSPQGKRLWEQGIRQFREHLDLKLMFNGAPRLVAGSTISASLTLPTSTTNQVGLTAGFWWWHNTYASAANKRNLGTMTEYNWIDTLGVAFDERGGSDHKVALLPRQAGEFLLKTSLGRQRFQVMTGDGKEMPLGMKFRRFDNGMNGVVDLVRYAPFEPRGANGLYKFAIIDKNRIGYVPYAGMDTFIERNLPVTKMQKIDYIAAAMGGVWHIPDSHVTGTCSGFAL